MDEVRGPCAFSDKVTLTDMTQSNPHSEVVCLWTLVYAALLRRVRTNGRTNNDARYVPFVSSQRPRQVLRELGLARTASLLRALALVSRPSVRRAAFCASCGVLDRYAVDLHLSSVTDL